MYGGVGKGREKLPFTRLAGAGRAMEIGHWGVKCLELSNNFIIDIVPVFRLFRNGNLRPQNPIDTFKSGKIDPHAQRRW